MVLEQLAKMLDPAVELLAVSASDEGADLQLLLQLANLEVLIPDRLPEQLPLDIHLHLQSLE